MICTGRFLQAEKLSDLITLSSDCPEQQCENNSASRRWRVRYQGSGVEENTPQIIGTARFFRSNGRAPIFFPENAETLSRLHGHTPLRAPTPTTLSLLSMVRCAGLQTTQTAIDNND
jgi:hypothetical protein